MTSDTPCMVHQKPCTVRPLPFASGRFLSARASKPYSGVKRFQSLVRSAVATDVSSTSQEVQQWVRRMQTAAYQSLSAHPINLRNLRTDWRLKCDGNHPISSTVARQRCGGWKATKPLTSTAAQVSNSHAAAAQKSCIIKCSGTIQCRYAGE